jgi:hypothetical protein
MIYAMRGPKYNYEWDRSVKSTRGRRVDAPGPGRLSFCHGARQAGRADNLSRDASCVGEKLSDCAITDGET